MQRNDSFFAAIGVFGTWFTAYANDILSFMIGVCTLTMLAPKAYCTVKRILRLNRAKKTPIDEPKL